MATRSGSIDPAILLYLQREHGLTAKMLSEGLERRGGLAGLYGEGGDLRAVMAAMDRGDSRAFAAYSVLLTGWRRAFGAMLASLGGLEGVVFTGGIGEHQSRVRRDLVASFGWMGLALDDAKNSAPIGDALISPPTSPVRVWRLEARENLEMARQVCALRGEA